MKRQLLRRTGIRRPVRGVRPEPRVLPHTLQWLQAHRQELDAVVLDVDGVLISARRALAGSRELVQWLRAERMPFVLLTNDGCNSPGEKLRSLRDCGLRFDREELVSASHALADLVGERGWRDHLFFLMGNLGRPCYARAAGLRTTRQLARIDACTGIVIGERWYDWARVITRVFNFLVDHRDAPMIVPNPDDCFGGHYGRLCLASGATGRFLADLCRRHGRPLQPIFLGKPFRPIFAHAHQHLEAKLGRPLPHRRVMILGDYLASDIRGGQAFGYRTALLLSGVTTPDMLAESQVRPDLAFARL